MKMSWQRQPLLFTILPQKKGKFQNLLQVKNYKEVARVKEKNSVTL